MDLRKRKKLEKAGWRIGSAREFLGLTQEESTLVEMRLSLARFIRDRRERRNLTQTALARRLGSSQSRIAKLEAGDSSVSLDLMVRAAVATGAKARDVAKALAARPRLPAFKRSNLHPNTRGSG